jgi:hypothetical protein
VTEQTEQTTNLAGVDASAGARYRTGPARGRPDQLGALLASIERDALFIVGVAAVIVLSVAGIPAHLGQDGWLALVAGRIIAAHGIPHHDYLTVMAHGVRWIDQQWLAQLVIYELQHVGGLALFAAVYIGLTGLALAIAIAAARRLGGLDRHIVAALPVAAFFYLATAVSIRTQGFAYPLFAASLWLLAADARKDTGRRVYLVFPILVLWGNLHGSATLGAGLAMLYGATRLLAGFQRERWRGLGDRRGLAFLIASPLCLVINPYGFSVVHYYDVTLFNPEFSKLVTEWQPVTAYTVIAIPYLLLLGVTIWWAGRGFRRTPLFDQLALAVLGLGGILAVRNITWFGLGAILLLPATISAVARPKPEAPRRTRLNLALGISSLALGLISILAVFTHPSSWFESTYPTRAVATVERIVGREPNVKIFADVRFGDWLLWHDPALAGHIAYDTSFELLTTKQLQSIATLTEALLPGQSSAVAPYGVLVLNPSNKGTNRHLLDQPGVKVVLRSKRVVIATKPVT